MVMIGISLRDLFNVTSMSNFNNSICSMEAYPALHCSAFSVSITIPANLQGCDLQLLCEKGRGLFKRASAGATVDFERQLEPCRGGSLLYFHSILVRYLPSETW